MSDRQIVHSALPVRTLAASTANARTVMPAKRTNANASGLISAKACLVRMKVDAHAVTTPSRASSGKRVLSQAAGGNLRGLFIDVVNPTRMSADELAREQTVGSDPWLRRRIFGRLGFRQVDVQYEQPVGGPNGGPVTNLDLLYCPPQPVD